MNFKLSLSITIVLGALMVVAQPPAPAPGPGEEGPSKGSAEGPGKASAEGTLQKPGSVWRATTKQKQLSKRLGYASDPH
ncbi:hypothetical protein K492DRAFT_194499 [Lichtheimia hyalospora FSU 10163]|nr:hypothetical protein K492DRAFT_194499 [Lichtheimia hyalospora FSU 10163]